MFSIFCIDWFKHSFHLWLFEDLLHSVYIKSTLESFILSLTLLSQNQSFFFIYLTLQYIVANTMLLLFFLSFQKKKNHYPFTFLHIKSLFVSALGPKLSSKLSCECQQQIYGSLLGQWMLSPSNVTLALFLSLSLSLLLSKHNWIHTEHGEQNVLVFQSPVSREWRTVIWIWFTMVSCYLRQLIQRKVSTTSRISKSKMMMSLQLPIQNPVRSFFVFNAYCLFLLMRSTRLSLLHYIFLILL